MDDDVRITNEETSSSNCKTGKEALKAAAEMIKRYNQKENVDE